MTDSNGAGMKNLKCCWELIKRRLSPNSLLFEDGDIYCRLSQKCLPVDAIDTTTVSRVAEFTCGISNCSQTFDTLIKYETHYNSSHRHVCHTCQKMFPSSHLLEVHVLETHDVMFSLLSEKQDMFQCLLADCPEKFRTSKDRKNHMVKIHRYPANNRYDRSANARFKKTILSTVDPPVSCNELAVKGIEEDMDTGISSPAPNGNINTGLQLKNRTFMHKVPNHISFGQGIPRGFLSSRGRGRKQQKKKHWHSSNQSATRVDIETVSMGDLSEALQ